VHEEPVQLQLGKALTFRNGNDLTLISTGGMLHTAARAADRLAADGIQARVLSMHTLKPLDTDAVLAAARETGAIATLEEHSIIGGLGSAVAEYIAELDGTNVPFKRLGLPSGFSQFVGSQEYLLAKHALSVDDVVRELRTLLGDAVSVT
jgi:transketolase